jgi:preprotein translocase subunit SecD
MKRILTFCLVVLSINAFASVRTVEVTPLASPLLDRGDFASASVTGDGARAVLNVRLTPDGARRMRDYTAAHVGEALPLVVDGKVVHAPVIRVPISGDGLQIEPLERAVADDVARLINGR